MHGILEGVGDFAHVIGDLMDDPHVDRVLGLLDQRVGLATTQFVSMTYLDWREIRSTGTVDGMVWCFCIAV